MKDTAARRIQQTGKRVKEQREVSIFQSKDEHEIGSARPKGESG